MTDVAYRNHRHYISEGWSAEPKEMFKRLAEILGKEWLSKSRDVLDVGCATGELLGFLRRMVPGGRFVGVDVSEDLLEAGRQLLPQAEFVIASALDLPGPLAGGFDLVTAFGCMSIFDEVELERFWDQLLAAARPGGRVIVLSPLNEFGCDMVIRHRKRLDGQVGSWERGWNIFAVETIADILAARGIKMSLQRFAITIDLSPRPDPVRTWTIATKDRERQLTNGLKLLIDHYFIIATKP